MLHRGAICLESDIPLTHQPMEPYAKISIECCWNDCILNTFIWPRIFLRGTNTSKSHGIRSRTYGGCSYLPSLYHLQHKEMQDCTLVLFGWTLPCGMLTLHHVTMFPFVLPCSFCCTVHYPLLITHSHVITWPAMFNPLAYTDVCETAGLARSINTKPAVRCNSETNPTSQHNRGMYWSQ